MPDFPCRLMGWVPSAFPSLHGICRHGTFMRWITRWREHGPGAEQGAPKP